MTTEISFKEPSKPTIFLMKRIWIALAIPVAIMLAWGAEAVSQSFMAWFFACAFIIFTAIPKYLDKRKNHSTIDYLNENNDGYYYHEFDKTSLLVDLNKKTIKLKEKNKEQTYPFSDIKTWRYDLTSSGKVIGVGITNGIIAKSQNDSNRLKDAKNSGFFISVKDIQNPEWQIKFFPKEGRFSDDKGFRDTEIQLKRWMQVFEQVLNQN
ncbi:hypothetical protein RN38_05230 [Hafnia paralvei]|jgi:hypothetical protein|uniref:DUF4755 domain-containing protein n=1 Tax=Hafnia paralvei TaxID=546367 RepID=UPI00057D5D7C|nr:DUF4755 domain-containing protein [Hafnia paralvei]EKN3361120.1 DUF4755 domain-containing protein [Yersinia ruckeri]EKN4202363.1 DUF4755 domain-containing protein [Yersinia ruckeri]EKN4724977.1 DUF4755 domain-containing protein [Yersinia ruckeri]ELV7522073.1 DUF4755 domain-containing protein [Yersinia ruckeri]KHS49761.1 hypothetical protein RN38_05230 [Hafnia paralvei]